ncbi:MAG: NACHT domain-containing protein [Candidatus Protochlamydia sp.]|nr:NACHT domain-containing protein [Candidatus Protochlamydia sp.]
MNPAGRQLPLSPYDYSFEGFGSEQDQTINTELNTGILPTINAVAEGVFLPAQQINHSFPSLAVSFYDSFKIIPVIKDLPPYYGDLKTHNDLFHIFFSNAIKCAKEGKYKEAVTALLKAQEEVRKTKSSIAHANFLEKLNRGWVKGLLEITKDPFLKILLLQKDAVRAAFELALQGISQTSNQEAPPTCFICFSIEEKVKFWLKEIFVQDLKKGGIAPIFCSEELKIGMDLDDFQNQICFTDYVIIICTPDLKNKCVQRAENPFGAVKEICLALNSREDKNRDTVCPIFLIGDIPPHDEFFNSFGTTFTLFDNRVPNKFYSYYEDVFRLFWRFHHPPGQSLINDYQLIKDDFEHKVACILNEAEIGNLVKWLSVGLSRPLTSNHIQKTINDFLNIYGQVGPEVRTQLINYYNSKNEISLLITQNPIKIPIEKIYTRLAIIEQKEKEAKNRKVIKANLGEEGYVTIPIHESIFEPKESIELEDLPNLIKAEDKKTLIVMQGAAGIGKTTIFHNMAYRWANKELFQEYDYLFWLPLRNLNKKHCSDCTLESFLSNECKISLKDIKLFLKNKELRKKTILFLDGYDELPPEALGEKGNFHLVLEELLTFPRIFITTRPHIFEFDPTLSLEILGFDEEGVEEYVEHFFSERQNLKAELCQYLKQPLLRSLARIPINLEIFCSLFSGKNKESLLNLKNPTVTSFYIQLTDWLNKRFIINRSDKNINPTRVKMSSRSQTYSEIKSFALEEIAWEAMQKNTLFLSVEEISHILNDLKSIEEMVQIGPLRIENGEAVFIHLTFQEFYAAVYLAHLFEKDPNTAKRQVEGIKLNPRFHLVLAMTAGYLSYNSKAEALSNFFDALFSNLAYQVSSYELKLQARCFAECREKDSDSFLKSLYQNFIKRVGKYLEEDHLDLSKVILLTGNIKLFNHPQILEIFKKKCLNSLFILSELAERGQIFDPPLLSEIIKQWAEGDLENLLFFLASLARNNHTLPDILPYAFQFLENHNANFEAKDGVVELLEKMAEANQKLFKKYLPKLKEFIKDEDPNSDFKPFVACETLAALARNGYFFQEDIVEILTAYLKIYEDEVFEPANEAKNRVNNSDEEEAVHYGAKYSAAQALREIANNPSPISKFAFGTMIHLLISPVVDSTSKDALAQAIGGLKENMAKEIQPQLIYYLTNREIDQETKLACAYALMSLESEGHPLPDSTIISWITFIKDNNNRTVLLEALEELAKIDYPLPESIFFALLNLLKDASLCVGDQYITLITLAELVSKSNLSKRLDFSPLLSILKDQNTKSIILATLQTLLAIGEKNHPLPQETILILINILERFRSIKIRSTAILALGELIKNGDSFFNAIYIFRENIKMGLHPEIQVAAIETLGKIAKAKYGCLLPEELAPELVNLLEDKKTDLEVKLAAIDSLKQLAKKGMFFDYRVLIELIHEENEEEAEEIQESALHALGAVALHSSEVLSGLVTFLKNEKIDKFTIFSILEKKIKKGFSLQEEDRIKITILLNNKEIDDEIKIIITDILRKLIRTGCTLTCIELDELIEFLKSPETNLDAQSATIKLLEEVLQNYNYLTLTTIINISNLIDYPFFENENKFFLFNRVRNNFKEIKDNTQLKLSTNSK